MRPVALHIYIRRDIDCRNALAEKEKRTSPKARRNKARQNTLKLCLPFVLARVVALVYLVLLLYQSFFKLMLVLLSCVAGTDNVVSFKGGASRLFPFAVRY